ncbi:MAG: type I-E CRISPR-associated protein Cse1/CasA [Spirochaetaceae bacterium]|nr:type I-E CRISPR-associated protein Cse1/CasA [Spirochaetaceae bacterium]
MSSDVPPEPCPTVFNLIDTSWLPVQRRSGGIERISPWQVSDRIEEDPIVAFAWPRPDFNGAAHEFLIGLLATAAAPADDDARGRTGG